MLGGHLPTGQAGGVGVQVLLGLQGVPARPECCCWTGIGHRSITPEPHATFSPAGVAALRTDDKPTRSSSGWGLGVSAPVPSNASWA